MMSHPLPDPVAARLSLLVQGIEEELQADGHRIPKALSQHAAFDERFVESALTRALICSSAVGMSSDSLHVVSLGNGGCEAWRVDNGVERRFRFKRAARDAAGQLVIRTGSDSLLTSEARVASLFDQEHEAFPETMQQWIIAYMSHPGTRTFSEVTAARIAGTSSLRAPFRLTLADVTPIAYTAPMPPDFMSHGDDLEIGDDEEQEGDGTADLG